jgi:hypothetical protein
LNTRAQRRKVTAQTTQGTSSSAPRQPTQPPAQPVLNTMKQQDNRRCYACGGQHRVEDCPDAKCFKCGNMGHIARHCKGPKKFNRFTGSNAVPVRGYQGGASNRSNSRPKYQEADRRRQSPARQRRRDPSVERNSYEHEERGRGERRGDNRSKSEQSSSKGNQKEGRLSPRRTPYRNDRGYERNRSGNGHPSRS